MSSCLQMYDMICISNLGILQMAAASPVADARGKKKEEIQLAKIMARSKYIDIMIKPMPMGGVVNLKMDNKCTIQYLYFLFRTNAGGAAAVHPRVNLFLPTYRGIFFLDCELIPETPTSLGSNAGYMTLANFNIVKVCHHRWFYPFVA